MTGSYKISPGLNATATTLTTKGNVVLDNVCPYLFQFPTGSGQNDNLYFRVNKADRAKVYYIIGTAFTDVNTQYGEAVKGLRYNLTYPQKAYLAVVATEIFAMDINIQVWAYDRLSDA